MTVARFPSLAHWGAFTALVEDGRVVGCEPFARDPAPSDMLRAIPDMVHSPLRIARPAMREGWREGNARTGADRFREVSWDEALAAVAAELARVRENFGHTAILGGSYGWSSAGRVHHARSLLRRFLFLGGGCVDQVGNYSFGAAQYILPRVIGTFQPVVGQVTDWSSIVKHTGLILAFGGLATKNGQVTSGGAGAHSMETWLRRAKDAGVEFVSISPLESDAPGFLGAQWIPIRPNTDTALMLAMAHTLVSEELHDAQFVARYCIGFERFHRYLLGARRRHRQGRAVGADDHRRSRRDHPRARAPRRRHPQHDNLRVVAAARASRRAAVLGGDRALRDAGRDRASRRRLRLRPRLDQRHRRAARRRRGPRGAAAAKPGAFDDPGRAHGRPAAHIPARAIEFNGRRYVYPDVRLVYWAGGNPFHHHQDLNRLQRAWQKPETVVVHESWWTPTARHADIVLPATTTLERNDVGGSSRDPFVLAMHRAIDPVGEAGTTSTSSARSRARLGYETAFTEDRDELGWCQWVYDQVRASAGAKGIALPGFQQFWAEGFVELPPPDRDFVLFEDFRRDPARHPLKTPSGRIEIVSEDDRRLRLCGLPAASGLAAAGGMARQRERAALADSSGHASAGKPTAQPDGSRTGVARHRRSRDASRSASARGDATRRGIGDGDVVRVFNARGACLAGAVLDAGVMPGVAVMATGAWFDPADAAGAPERHGNPNVLTLDIGTSPLAQGTSALTALVEIERWDAPAPAVRAFTPPQLAAV